MQPIFRLEHEMQRKRTLFSWRTQTEGDLSTYVDSAASDAASFGRTRCQLYCSQSAYRKVYNPLCKSFPSIHGQEARLRH